MLVAMTFPVVSMSLLCGVDVFSTTQSALLNHPVFSKYPSPEDLQERIEAFKRERADEFETARRDFDLAMRSGLELTPIAFADERQPVRIKKWIVR